MRDGFRPFLTLSFPSGVSLIGHASAPSLMRYSDFVLQILPGPMGEPVVHVQSERGEGRAPFRLPFDAATWRADLAEVIARGRNLIAQGEARPGAHREIGEELFEALFSGEVLRLYERCLDRIEGQPDLGLRIKLVIDPREPQLAPLQDLPWELMRQPGTPEFLTLSRRRLFVRYLAVPRPIERIPRPQVLRVLCVAASPAGSASLALDRELRYLQEAAVRTEGIEVVELVAPTLEGVRRALLEKECHILHFMGHGDAAAADEGVLWFESPDGGGDPIRGEDLANKLADIPSLRLAVLNACDSGATGAGLFSGVASSLVLGGLPAVVAMRSPISDQAAVVFSQTFYSGLMAGDPVDLAVTEARQAMHSKDPGRFEWATPVVYMRIPDGHLYFSEPTDTRIDVSSAKPGGRMPTRKWYQNSKVAVPVLVALIGLAGAVVTGLIEKNRPDGKPETPVQSSPAPQSAEPVSKPAAPPPSEPQVTFPIIVIDDLTGDQIAGARVVADEQGVSTETDDQGRCELTVRPGLGRLRVTVSKQGYKSQNINLTIFEGMGSARIRLEKS